MLYLILHNVTTVSSLDSKFEIRLFRNKFEIMYIINKSAINVIFINSLTE
jgi:hypothetical protein